MKIIEKATGIKIDAVITEVQTGDLNALTKKRYSFSWKQFKEPKDLYKLQIKGNDDVLGVMYLEDTPAERRIEIKLLACSVENKGRNKVFDGIAGCLIAYACQIAKMKYRNLACVSLLPKTLLRQHYVEKYNMVDAGWQLYIEGEGLDDIIEKYLL